jgi:hypothetical protein
LISFGFDFGEIKPNKSAGPYHLCVFHPLQ